MVISGFGFCFVKLKIIKQGQHTSSCPRPIKIFSLLFRHYLMLIWTSLVLHKHLGYYKAVLSGFEDYRPVSGLIDLMRERETAEQVESWTRDLWVIDHVYKCSHLFRLILFRYAETNSSKSTRKLFPLTFSGFIGRSSRWQSSRSLSH